MSKIKAIVVSKFALLVSIVSLDKNKNSGNFINLKKASAEEIEKSRCKKYDYAA